MSRHFGAALAACSSQPLQTLPNTESPASAHRLRRARQAQLVVSWPAPTTGDHHRFAYPARKVIVPHGMGAYSDPGRKRSSQQMNERTSRPFESNAVGAVRGTRSRTPRSRASAAEHRGPRPARCRYGMASGRRPRPLSRAAHLERSADKRTVAPRG